MRSVPKMRDLAVNSLETAFAVEFYSDRVPHHKKEKVSSPVLIPKGGKFLIRFLLEKSMVRAKLIC
jgi:hypothetical protein